MAKIAKLLILIEVANSRTQCCDLLCYIANAQLKDNDYMIAYTAIINKMRTF